MFLYWSYNLFFVIKRFKYTGQFIKIFSLLKYSDTQVGSSLSIPLKFVIHQNYFEPLVYSCVLGMRLQPTGGKNKRMFDKITNEKLGGLETMRWLSGWYEVLLILVVSKTDNSNICFSQTKFRMVPYSVLLSYSWTSIIQSSRDKFCLIYWYLIPYVFCFT